MTGPTFSDIEQARACIPRTLMLVGENKSASWVWRVAWPTRALADHGYICDWVGQTSIANALGAVESGRYNIILTPRAHWPTQELADQWIDSVRDYGLAWVYELDDDGWSPDIVKRQARLFEAEWFKGEQALEQERQERIALINRSDGVLVSSERLAAVARQYTDCPVWLVPNLIDADWFLGRISDAKRIIDPLTIGWSGGVRDETDLLLVGEAWSRVAKRYPEVKFVVHGTTPLCLTQAVPDDQLVLVAWSDFPDYPRSLMNIDIMCCAVQAGVDFNAAKTPIKWMEASLAGAACVVSEALYGPAVEHEQTGLVASTVDEWDEYLSRLVEDADYRAELAARAKQTVMEEHTISRRWSMWVETLAGILADAKQPVNGLVHAGSN